MNDCPFCHRRLPGYDTAAKHPKVWRAVDFGGILVEIEYSTHRVRCPEHGIVTADVPWAYPGSSFTKDFDLAVAWLAKYLPRSAVSNYMRIDWETVGNCISRSLHDLEPERSRRLNGLVNIGIDETSYRKGHKYITLIVNHDTNEVVWVAHGHGKSVLEQFYKGLTPEQLSSIKVVTGDGARWITDCVNEFTPDCERCVDPFHVVEWAMDALDEVRKERWHKAYEEASKLAKENPQKRGRPKSADRVAAAIKAACDKASEIKDSTYSLGKAPEHLTNRQQVRLDLIQAKDLQLLRAYSLKESLRLLLKIQDVNQAEKELKHWLFWTSHSRIPAFKELYKKIKRHKEHILNTIRFGLSNARIEATNNKIKLIIRKAYGFRNIQNMMDMVYLVCSNVRIPLPNRNLPSAE
ncbi:ISL3 family transposase [Alloscardovia venturai]|uniref:ISL3 family transposase n=1 Tax=Alloscardovia venturai TaxID=1769421 RepID=A0ABW2Y2X3_9BIFI